MTELHELDRGARGTRFVTVMAAAGLAVGVGLTGALVATGTLRHEAKAAGPIQLVVGDLAGPAATGGGDASDRSAAPAVAVGEGAPGTGTETAIWRWQPTFEAADLPDLRGSAPAYRVPPASEQDVRRLARAFGLDGSPAAQEDVWAVGSLDGSGPGLQVGRSEPWFAYFDPAASPKWATAEVCEPASPGTAGGSAPAVEPAPDRPVTDATTAVTDIATVCRDQAPEPVTGLPSDAEATAQVRSLLRAVGADDAVEQVVNRSDWSVDVQVVPSVGGIRVDELGWYVSFGRDGKVASAGGTLGRPVKVAEYELIGTPAALERLRSGDPFLMGWSSVATVGGERSAGADVAVAPGGTVASGTAASGDPVVAPQPAQPEAPVVRLTGVERGLIGLVGPDGVRTLVPAYVFTSDDGGQWPVLGIDARWVVRADAAVASGSSSGSGAAEPAVAVGRATPVPATAAAPSP